MSTMYIETWLLHEEGVHMHKHTMHHGYIYSYTYLIIDLYLLRFRRTITTINDTVAPNYKLGETYGSCACHNEKTWFRQHHHANCVLFIHVSCWKWLMIQGRVNAMGVSFWRLLYIQCLTGNQVKCSVAIQAWL